MRWVGAVIREYDYQESRVSDIRHYLVSRYGDKVCTYRFVLSFFKFAKLLHAEISLKGLKM